MKLPTLLRDEPEFDVLYKPFRAGEVRFNYADISKACKMLGYDPCTGLREGLERTWKWFLEQKSKKRKMEIISC